MDRLFPENWPLIRRLPPYRRGLIDALLGMIFISSMCWFFCAQLNVRANADVLRTLAEIGATLLVAYGIVASNVVSAAQAEVQEKRKERVGAFIGIGCAGLIGIISALVLSQRAWVANPSWLEEFGFGWTVGSLAMFFVMVAFQADVVDSWLKPTPSGGRSHWLTRNRRRSN